MIDGRLLLEDFEFCVQSLSRKGVLKSDLLKARDLILKRNQSIAETQHLQSQKNKISREIRGLMGGKGRDQAEKAKAQVRKLKKDLEKSLAQQALLKQQAEDLLLNIPNFPDKEAPSGSSSKHNVEILRENFDPKDFSSEKSFLPHWEIMEELGIFDQKRAGKISGSMFAVLKGSGARLLRALIAFATDIFTGDYTEVIVPSLVNSESLRGTGQLPKFAEEAYHMEKDDLWAIPTGEAPLTALHREEILDEKLLPLKYMTYTPCFRREAGAAGEASRGLQRLHEFHKLELVKICKPSFAKKELKSLLEDCLKPLRLLKLPLRVMDLSAGDMTFSAARTYDIELYSPGTKAWLEASSVGLFTDYQSRRSQIRYREGRNIFYPHTLNGSGLATPRVMAALLENYREGKGRVKVPPALLKYMGKKYL